MAVTRARAQASSLADRLRRLGAEVVETPAIRIEPRPVPAELAQVGEYALVCVTSPNGAALMMDGLAEHGLDARALAGQTVAAIGPGTAGALAEHGIRADVVPPRSIAESLVEALEDVPVEGRRVMVARAAEARDVLPEALSERGAEVDVVPLYDTVAEPLDDAGRAALESADYVTFTSSSTVRFLMEAAGAFPDGARLVSIGPVTSATAREHGLEVHVEADRHDIDGLVDALVGDATRMIVSLLTDYGTEDDFVGTCHGVIASIAPDARILDVTHGIPRFDVRRGAIALHDSLPYLPVGVHVGVVDPQVGTERRGVALQCHDGRVLVGPDNGLLSLAWRTAGGVDTAVDITLSPHRLEPVSATFHGRDVFAPVAAHIAAGETVEDSGTPLEPRSLQELEPLWPEQDGDTLVARVLFVDGFGNATLNVPHGHIVGSGLTLGGEVEVTAGGRTHTATFTSTFADVAAGELLVYEDAHRRLALAVNRGAAVRELELERDAEVRLRPR